MKRLAAKLALAAAAISLMAGAASAQTVASIHHAGLDPASGKAPKMAVIMFHGYTQKGEAMKPIAEALAKRLPDAVFIFDNAPNTQGSGFSGEKLSLNFQNIESRREGSRDGSRQNCRDHLEAQA